MDSLIAAAGRALAGGDALGALKRVALRDDPPALALRGIALAQLGEHGRARELLKRAARGFGAHEELSSTPTPPTAAVSTRSTPPTTTSTSSPKAATSKTSSPPWPGCAVTTSIRACPQSRSRRQAFSGPGPGSER